MFRSNEVGASGELGLLPSPLWEGAGGGGHSSKAMTISAGDAPRASYKVCEANCCRVFDIGNDEILANIRDVLADLLSAITRTPTPNPSPQGGGEHTERGTSMRGAGRGSH